MLAAVIAFATAPLHRPAFAAPPSTAASPVAARQPHAVRGWVLHIHLPRAGSTQTLRWDARSARARLPASRIRTSVPWEREVGTHVWEGISLKRLMTELQVEGSSLRIGAINDYNATIPWDDIVRFDPLLAWRRDGKDIPVREKGPLIVIYPFDSDPALLQGETLRRSVWHVNEIHVQP